MTDFARALESVIAAEGITQSKFAEECGIAPSTLTAYLHRHKRPEKSVLRRICARQFATTNGCLSIIKGHLNDEMRGAGLTRSDIRMEHEDMPLPLPEVERLVDTLRARLYTDPRVKSIVEGLCDILNDPTGNGPKDPE
jgi:transcriptional regulator with XRE-family HTH domain